MKVNKPLKETREGLYAALGKVINAAPEAERNALAQALEDFWDDRRVVYTAGIGVRTRKMGRIGTDLLDVVEEATEATVGINW